MGYSTANSDKRCMRPAAYLTRSTLSLRFTDRSARPPNACLRRSCMLGRLAMINARPTAAKSMPIPDCEDFKSQLLSKADQAEGECAWCGAGNACCSLQGKQGPLECRDAQFLSLESFQCVAPKYSPAIKHSGQDCLSHCKGAGMCDWCGRGNACCRKQQSDDPAECRGVTSFSRPDVHVCVRPVQKVSEDHFQQDCWKPCDKTPGYCSWCGQGMACCRKGAQNDPFECHGVTSFSRSDQHVCVQPLSANPAILLAASSSVNHAGRDCWYECGGSGFCSWCGAGNACCRFGAHFDAEECSGATEFSSTQHHVCVAVPCVINKAAGLGRVVLKRLFLFYSVAVGL